jgi:hypothetical protein
MIILLYAGAGCGESDTQPGNGSNPGDDKFHSGSPDAGTNSTTFALDENPTGNPIGGGEGYTDLVTKYDYNVSTKEELISALEQAGSGKIVYVDDGAEIDLTGHETVIPGGVTLASGRGDNGSDGALIFNTELTNDGGSIITMLVTGGAYVRVTGLRLRGPDTERRSSAYVKSNGRGIQAHHPHLKVDNCELWGWSHAAVFLADNGASDAYIHHNYMHHNQRSGLGYGICLKESSNALIQANKFDYCRHHIAGTGAPGTSYEASYNLCLTHANGHNFDMHGGKDRGDGTNIAGDWMNIHHNEFRSTSVVSITIRGIPTEGANIHHNWFYISNPGSAVTQLNATGGINKFQNQYGSSRTLKD